MFVTTVEVQAVKAAIQSDSVQICPYYSLNLGINLY